MNVAEARHTGNSVATATPGPYRLDTDEIDFTIVSLHGHVIGRVATANDFGVFEPEIHEALEAEARANAALLMAAPVLLDALRELLHASEPYGSDADGHAFRRLALARDAACVVLDLVEGARS